jgi:TrmH family RNA methyltransferase
MSLKNDAKLKEKKYRTETGLFLVEGRKGILELLASDFEILRIYTTIEASEEIENAATQYRERRKNTLPEIEIVTEKQLVSLGTLDTNDAGIAVAKQRPSQSEGALLSVARKSYVLALDDVQDPGNLGTIIRTADWFGITHIATSPTTVDFYNPKVIRASMGSFTRVQVISTDIASLIAQEHIPSFGAVLDGAPLNSVSFRGHGVIVMGSESHGLSSEILERVTEKVTIPRYGHAESLNVAIATALILSEMRRGHTSPEVVS